MARKKKDPIFFKYECTLTGEKFTVTRKAAQPENLVSVKAWYELNPDKDDRPENIKKTIQVEAEQAAQMAALNVDLDSE